MSADSRRSESQVVPNALGSAWTPRVIGGLLAFCLCGSLLISVVAWVLPVEVVQGWAVARAAADDFARFEASEAAAATVWFARYAASAIALFAMVAWIRRRRVIAFLGTALSEFWVATSFVQVQSPPHGAEASSNPCPMSRCFKVRQVFPQLIVVGWVVLAAYHAGQSVNRRLWDWPVYRLKPGQSVLPNISDGNREVIRYLEAATPPGSRIFVVSDQKLFFLSYYLLPRRLVHRTHPDSEFVIPLAFNQRPMAAYRLNDVNANEIARLRPDFVLEYFEGASFLENEDLMQDRQWIAFQRRRHGPAWQPQFLVALQPRVAGEAR